MSSSLPLVLSVFPGADLLGRGFESAGFCVVRGPDTVWGGDVRTFHPPAGAFAGVIGGSPCQEFSTLNRTEPTGYGVAMLRQFCRVVAEAAPDWFLLENVPAVPCVAVDGYTVQRFNLRASECGGRQRRNRCFQFGFRSGSPLVIRRERSTGPAVPLATASEFARSGRRGWAEFCALQGLPPDFDLPGLSVGAKYRAVGNGVPVFVARVIAQAIAERNQRSGPAVAVCPCGCGRAVVGRAEKVAASVSCRKRLERIRRGEIRAFAVTATGTQPAGEARVTPAPIPDAAAARVAIA